MSLKPKTVKDNLLIIAVTFFCQLVSKKYQIRFMHGYLDMLIKTRSKDYYLNQLHQNSIERDDYLWQDCTLAIRSKFSKKL